METINHNLQELEKILNSNSKRLFDVLKIDTKSLELEDLNPDQRLLFARIKQYFPDANYQDIWATNQDEVKNLLKLNWKAFKICIKKLLEYCEWLP